MAHHVSGLMSFATYGTTVRHEKTPPNYVHKLSKHILPQRIGIDKGKMKKSLKQLIYDGRIFTKLLEFYKKFKTNLKGETNSLITKDSKIFDIIQRFPEATKVFDRFGMGCIGCMGVINETIENGAKMHRISIEELLAELNKIGYNQQE